MSKDKHFAVYPISYTIGKKDCPIFSLCKVNKATVTYEVRVNDDFSFRVYIPQNIALMLGSDGQYAKGISLLVCSPDDLESIISFNFSAD